MKRGQSFFQEMSCCSAEQGEVHTRTRRGQVLRWALMLKGGQSQERRVRLSRRVGLARASHLSTFTEKRGFQGQVSCMLGRGQEQRTVEASTVRAEASE